MSEELEKAASEKPLSDEEWILNFAWVSEGKLWDSQEERIRVIRMALAEGRRRQVEGVNPETGIVTLFSEGAFLAIQEHEIQQREEAAAREMAEMVVKDCQYRSLDMSVEWLMQEFKKWKRRKSQGGIGV